MNSFFSSKPKLLYYIIGISVLIFIPSLTSFFSADDWFHLRISQIKNIQEFINFFSFNQSPQIASFYRPLTTQVFFFINQKLFGFWSPGWYMVNLVFFAFLIFTIYNLVNQILLTLKISKDKLNKYILLVTTIYGLSVTHFTHLYFLSTFQEIGMITSVSLVLFNYLKNNYKSTVFWFLISLLTKETAIVTPILILLLDILILNRNFSISSLFQVVKKFIFTNRLILIISILYLLLRFITFPKTIGDSYIWDFSISKFLNTLFWYINWSIGVPEMVVDFIGSGLKPIPRFYTVWGDWWILILVGFAANILLIGKLLLNFKTVNFRIILFSGLWFLACLLPVLFLPWHKFVHSLGLPMIGFSIFIAFLISNAGKGGWVLLGTFVTYNLIMNYFNFQFHPTINRSKISYSVFNYFKSNYSQGISLPVLFIEESNDFDLNWGGDSKQLYNAINNSELLKAIYNNHQQQVYFQFNYEPQISNNYLVVPSSQFIK